jgi:hypothetical protein
MRAVIHAAYLRVYVPDDEDVGLPDHVAPRTARRSVIVSGTYGVWEESLREDALRLEFEGRGFVCPRYPRLRMLEGLLAFHNSFPDMGGSVLVPEEVVSRAAAELQAMHREQPDVRSHILTSPWHVPLRWFAAFESAQRELVQSEDGSTIRYRTMRADASRRLTRATTTLEKAGFDESVIDPVEGLTSWLDDFPEEAVVELDYGSVAELFGDTELALDETAAEVAASLNALDSGDFDEASDYYAAAAARWALAQARMYAN